MSLARALRISLFSFFYLFFYFLYLFSLFPFVLFSLEQAFGFVSSLI